MTLFLLTPGMAGGATLTTGTVTRVILGAALPWLVLCGGLFIAGIGLEGLGEARGEGPYGPLRGAASLMALVFFPAVLGALVFFLPAAIRAGLLSDRSAGAPAAYWQRHRRMFLGTAL